MGACFSPSPRLWIGMGLILRRTNGLSAVRPLNEFTTTGLMLLSGAVLLPFLVRVLIFPVKFGYREDYQRSYARPADLPTNNSETARIWGGTILELNEMESIVEFDLLHTAMNRTEISPNRSAHCTAVPAVAHRHLAGSDGRRCSRPCWIGGWRCAGRCGRSTLAGRFWAGGRGVRAGSIRGWASRCMRRSRCSCGLRRAFGVAPVLGAICRNSHPGLRALSSLLHPLLCSCFMGWLAALAATPGRLHRFSPRRVDPSALSSR